MAMIPGLKLTGKKNPSSLDLAGKNVSPMNSSCLTFVANGVHFGEVRGEALIPWGLALGKEKKKHQAKISNWSPFYLNEHRCSTI